MPKRIVETKKKPMARKGTKTTWGHGWGTTGIVGRAKKKREDALEKIMKEANSGRNGRR